MSGADSTRRDSDESISLFKAALLLFALLFLLLALAFGTDRLLRTDNFPVRNVRFEGEFKHVTQQELQAAVMSVVHGNFFLLNLDAVKARVESLPWVYKASVRRQWPQDVYVRFTEQQLAAYWGDGAYLNQAGDVVRVKADDLPAEFPRLEGPEGTGAQVLEHYKSLGRILAAAGLKLERITLTPRRTWRLVVMNGDGQGRTNVAEGKGLIFGSRMPGATMAIVLDREQPERKLERFARVYVQSFALLASDIRQVDLRYANGFSVEQAGGQTAGYHDASGRTSIGRAGVANKG
ncbi:cell division protein FtsQ/DivIB [Sulfuricaulis sp.]|jgi:cell division protein FtsQ|uniref:cell division protein FtsQ/DivIB n=1 Tax=Sulfuricaulis sp. TaxID=2003553 RepID=UPI00355A3E8A